MVDIIQKQDLGPDFTNDDSLTSGGVGVNKSSLSTAGSGAPVGAPAAGAPLVYYDNSTTPWNQYVWDGAAWNLVGDGDGGGGDGVLTGATLDASNVLTLTRSVGAPVTVDLSAIADGVLTGATLDASNVLTLTRSDGAPVTVDLSALADGAVSVLTEAAGVLTHDDGDGSVSTFDLPALVSATATPAEAAAILQQAAGGTSIPNATAAQIAALDGDDDLLVDIDGTGLRRVAWTDLPAGGGAGAAQYWNSATGKLDLSWMQAGDAFLFSFYGNGSPQVTTSGGTAFTQSGVYGHGMVYYNGTAVLVIHNYVGTPTDNGTHDGDGSVGTPISFQFGASPDVILVDICDGAGMTILP